MIMVTEFIGFLADYRDSGSMNPIAAATLAAVLTTWVTFIPSFLWIFAGAPFMERMRGNAALSGAMAATTGAVVGVLLNLAVWFGLHVVFREVATLTLGPLRWDVPVLDTIDWPSLILTLLATPALFRLTQSVITVLLASAVLGIAWKVLS